MSLSIFVSSQETELTIFARVMKFELTQTKLNELRAVFIFSNNYCGCAFLLKAKHASSDKNKRFYLRFVQRRNCLKFFHIYAVHCVTQTVPKTYLFVQAQ